jgi:hypothetical protein
MVMQKIFVNGQETSVDEFMQMCTFDDDEIDFDFLGAALDSRCLEVAMDSFDRSYSAKELLEKYLTIINEPIEVTT